MRYFTARDNRRLARSALAAFILHAVVFVLLSIVVAVNGSGPADYGPMTLTFESEPAPLKRAEAAVEREEPKPSPPPKAVQAPPRSKKTETKAAVAPAPKTASKNGTAAPVKDGTVKEPAPAKIEEPASQLDTGSLSRLDAALKDPGTKTSSDGAGGGGGGGKGGSNTSTRWEDNATRELLSQTAPVIPKWVSEQGLRLKVELSVELSPEGFVLIRGTKVSSGYPDVDAAVAKAVSRWKYSRGAGTKNVKGTITYFIELK